MKGRFVLATGSISETKRVRYLLGLCSPAEREHIESKYFEDEDAFLEMLTTEDDLIDAYARGELAGEERRRFEKSFVNSLRGRDRVQFARAFTNTVSATRSGETKLPGTLLDTFRSPGLFRTAMIAAMIVLVGMLAWLVIDRRRMANEFRELRAESAKLSDRAEALQRNSDTERTRTAEIATQLADLRAQADKRTHRERPTTATQLRKTTELPLEARNVPSLLTLQTATTHDGNVARRRADLVNVTLDGVSLESLDVDSLIPRNVRDSGGTIVHGTVKDPQGTVLSGATVTLTDPAGNFTRTLSTNKDGAYVFNAIRPGTYSLNVQAPGFKTVSVSGLATRDTATLCDVLLEIGSISDTVNVNAAEALINRSDATLRSSFERKHITKLPLNVNVSLLTLQTAVSHKVSNGRPAEQSNITLNSVHATIRIPSFLSWIRFQIALATVAIHEDYRVTIKTGDGRPVTSGDWIEPLTPNQTTIDTPVISTGDLPSGDYVLLLMGKEPDGSFVKVAQYSFTVIKCP